jgi:hypothetical protein
MFLSTMIHNDMRTIRTTGTRPGSTFTVAITTVTDWIRVSNNTQ